MIALTELFIHDAHEPSMTAASDILWKPACLSRQEAPSLTEGDGTCRPGNGDRNTSASRPENHETMGEKDHAENRKAPRPRSGRVILLNGASSAGKSTLVKLLMRLYDPAEGRILVNGIDIREYQVKAYRNLFATAFQNGKIFADTVEENVLMGQHTTPEEDKRRVWQALKLADISEEIESRALREKTILTREFSKEGAVLSGGQNQKILAARAFAKDSPVAVFDEPSSALDPLAEYHLFENIKEYGKDRILFFISHRLSSVRDADIVFYMKNGRIRERGSHRELMEQNGEYASLYRLQAENYLS